MKTTRWLSLFAAGLLALGLLLSGCSAPAEDPGPGEESSSQAEPSSQEPETRVPALYISGGDGSFREYPFVGSGQVTPESLISAMGELTGWDLTLSGEDPVSGSGDGLTVSFAPESVLFTGLPGEQREGFAASSEEQLCYMVLDSIQKTLQENFSPEDPGALDICFCTDDGAGIELESLGITLPPDEPYSHALLEQLLLSASMAEPDSGT